MGADSTAGLRHSGNLVHKIKIGSFIVWLAVFGIRLLGSLVGSDCRPRKYSDLGSLKND